MKRKIRFTAFIVLAICGLIAGTAYPETPSGVNLEKWEKLTESEKASFRERFNRREALSETQKNEIKQKIEQFKTLPQEEQQRIRKNFTKFNQLQPEERQELVQKYLYWKGLSPEKRNLIRQHHMDYQNLTPSQRSKIIQDYQRWKESTSELRKKQLQQNGALLPIYDILYDSEIRHILARHEQGAAHAADGYARASGRACMHGYFGPRSNQPSHGYSQRILGLFAGHCFHRSS